MRKLDEGVSCLLAGTEIEQAYLASAEFDGHFAVECYVGQHQLDCGRVVAAAPEAVDASCHLLGVDTLHDARCFLLGDCENDGRHDGCPCVDRHATERAWVRRRHVNFLLRPRT
jgi:hypothetical protein